MDTVWVVHPCDNTNTDITPALNWGHFKFINAGYANPSDVINDVLSQQIMENLIAAAQDFNPTKDFLLLAGDHLQLMQMSFLLAEQNKPYMVLRWDRHANGYYPVHMTFSRIPYPLQRRDDRAKVDVATVAAAWKT